MFMVLSCGEMEFVRKRSEEIHLVQCNYVKVPSLPLLRNFQRLFCKFLQGGINKIFFIFCGETGASLASSVVEVFMLKYFIVFRHHCQKYFEL